jgi:DNA-binding HxlR family transcriptional regulator
VRVTSDAPRNRKSYAQFCTVARALDFIGDRWTMLILRELLGGPARFLELRAGLPGIASNLLTDRLRRMEEDGLLRRHTSRSSVVYTLSDRGAATRSVIEALGHWGASVDPVVPPVHARSSRSVAMALAAILLTTSAVQEAEPVVIELELDGEAIELVLGPKPTATARPAAAPDARIRLKRPGIRALLALRPIDAADLEHLDGNTDAVDKLLRALSRSSPKP